jgi:hypothetical protein
LGNGSRKSPSRPASVSMSRYHWYPEPEAAFQTNADFQGKVQDSKEKTKAKRIMKVLESVHIQA